MNFACSSQKGCSRAPFEKSRFGPADEIEVRRKLKNDPWTEHGILKLETVKRWEIFIDQRK